MFRNFLTNPTVQAVFHGLGAVVGGIRYVQANRPLWRSAVVPTVVFALLAVVLAVLGIWGALEAASALLGEPETSLEALAAVLVRMAFMAAAVLAAVFLALALAQPLSGFSLDRIARAQAIELAGDVWPVQSRLAALRRGLKLTLVTLGVGLPVLVVLTLFAFVFPPATAVTVPVTVLASAWLLAWDLCDYPFTLHGWGMRARLAWIRANWKAYTTFGLVWMIALVVPAVALVLLPLGVASATRLVVREEVRVRVRSSWEA
jgi:CysZ protein